MRIRRRYVIMSEGSRGSMRDVRSLVGPCHRVAVGEIPIRLRRHIDGALTDDYM